MKLYSQIYSNELCFENVSHILTSIKKKKRKKEIKKRRIINNIVSLYKLDSFELTNL